MGRLLSWTSPRRRTTFAINHAGVDLERVETREHETMSPFHERHSYADQFH